MSEVDGGAIPDARWRGLAHVSVQHQWLSIQLCDSANAGMPLPPGPAARRVLMTCTIKTTKLVCGSQSPHGSLARHACDAVLSGGSFPRLLLADRGPLLTCRWPVTRVVPCFQARANFWYPPTRPGAVSCVPCVVLWVFQTPCPILYSTAILFSDTMRQRASVVSCV